MRDDGRIRPRARAVRPADRQLPGGGPAAGRRLHRRQGIAADAHAGGMAHVGGSARRHRRGQSRRSGPPMPDIGWRTPSCTCTAASASTPITRCIVTSWPPRRPSSRWAARPASCVGSAVNWRKPLPSLPRAGAFNPVSPTDRPSPNCWCRWPRSTTGVSTSRTRSPAGVITSGKVPRSRRRCVNASTRHDHRTSACCWKTRRSSRQCWWRPGCPGSCRWASTRCAAVRRWPATSAGPTANWCWPTRNLPRTLGDIEHLNVDSAEWADEVAAHRDAEPRFQSASPADLFMLIFTSGTSGDPKAVKCSHGKVAIAGVTMTQRFDLGRDDVCYVSMPLFHSNAVLVGWAVAAACQGSMALRRKFSASEFLTDIRRYGATYANYVGKPLSYVLATPERADDADNPLRAVYGNEGVPRRHRALRPQVRTVSSRRVRFDRRRGGDRPHPRYPAGCVGSADRGDRRSSTPTPASRARWEWSASW